MSVRQMAAVWDIEELAPHLKLVLLAIADHSNDEGLSWPAQERLAEKCGVGARALRNTLTKLQELGYVEVVRRDRKQTNLYQLHVIGSPLPLTLQSDRQPTAGGDRQPTATPQEPPVEPPLASPSSGGNDGGAEPPSKPEEPPPKLPAERWATQWAELRGIPVTRAVLRAWVPMVLEYMAAGGEPSVELLEAAKERGIETPAGWSFVGKRSPVVGAGPNGYPAGYPPWVVASIITACTPEARVDRRWAAEFDYGPHSEPPEWKRPIIQAKQQALRLSRQGATIDETTARALLRAELGREKVP